MTDVLLVSVVDVPAVLIDEGSERIRPAPTTV